MSTIINQVYASAPVDYVIIDTLELICAAWPDSLRLVMGYEDLLLGTEDGRTVVFTAAPMTIEYPKKSNEPEVAFWSTVHDPQPTGSGRQ